MFTRTLLLFLVFAISATAQRSWKPDEVLARVDRLPGDFAEFADRHGVIGAKAISARWLLLTLQDERVEMACERLAAQFARVQPNYTYETRDTPNDSLFAQQFSVDLLRLEDAWDLTLGPEDGSSGHIIAVIDNGVDYTHEDLSANMWDGSFCSSATGDILDNCVHGYDFAGDDLDPAPSEGHGTHVAGVIAAVSNNSQGISGVSRSARIMALKTDLSTAQVVQALGFAAANGAQIANLSWGFGATTCAAVFDQSLYDAIADFDGLVVIAAGDNNEAHDLSTWFDVADFGHDTSCWNALPNVISVTATDSNDARGASADYGSGVDIAAPGIAVHSTEPGDNYGDRRGSSIAAAHAAGAAALIWGYVPDLGGTDLRAALLAGADTISTDQGDMLRLNAYKAIARFARPEVANLAIFTDSSQQTAIAEGGSTSVRRPYFRWDAPTDQGVISHYNVFSSLGSFDVTEPFFDAAARGLSFDVGEHELYVSAHNDAGATADPLSTFFTVTAPTVNFVQSSIDLPESQTIVIQVELSEAASANASVSVELLLDDEPLRTENLTWLAGESGIRQFSFNIDNEVIEDDRSISGSLANPVNVLLGEETEVGFTVFDDDPRIGISLSDASAHEDEFLIFGFQLTAPAEVRSSFDFVLTPGTAKAGEDYVDSPTTNFVNVGRISGTLVVPVVDDATMEGTKSFGIQLTNLDGVQADLSTLNATGTILDNDLHIDLQPGWNLVGSRLQPDVARAGLLQAGEVAWYWDADRRAYRHGDLSRAGAGHWVYTTVSRQIVATGRHAPVPPIRAGWNLLTPIDNTPAGLFSFGWDGSNYTQPTEFLLGAGYWQLLPQSK